MANLIWPFWADTAAITEQMVPMTGPARDYDPPDGDGSPPKKSNEVTGRRRAVTLHRILLEPHP
jgi:hypothetical protein